MSALDSDLQPIFMPKADHPPLVRYGAGSPEIDYRIEKWLDDARLIGMAYRRSLRPQTERFRRDLAAFDRFHRGTPEHRKELLWRLPALSIAINRLLNSSDCNQPTLWRCYALHLADFEQAKASLFSAMQAKHEMAYAVLAGSFVKAATRGTP
jgi:hypothetical protein